MDVEEFRVRGKEMVDYICTYMNTLNCRQVTPSVEPGYLRALLPTDAPQYPESWDDVMKDVEQKIMPGVTHWQHPRFHAYFPAGNAYPCILADMLSSGIGCVGFSWASSPACTELEIIMLDWMGQAIGLPPAFIASGEDSKGGGCINGSASENVLVSMLAARATAIKRLKKICPDMDENVLLSKLVGYTSKEAHSCVEKAGMISFVKLRILQSDEHSSLRGETLKQAMKEDQAAGLVPFYVAATLGTTSCCSYDNLPEIGQVVREFPCVWLHVDAAYAGSSFLCPEHKHRLAGVEYADSINVNPNKLMLTSFDCSMLWVTNKYLLIAALLVDPLYIYDHKVTDYRNWSVALSRRFRSFKLWFMLRSYGISGLQKYVRRHCELAKYFEQLVKKDKRFTISNDVTLGLVCFRLCGHKGATRKEINELNKQLLININASHKLHMVPAMVRDYYIIRFCVVYQFATREDIEIAWKIIKEYADEILAGPQKLLKEDRSHRNCTELKNRESHFVRMVSDTKTYNPLINTSFPPGATMPGQDTQPSTSDQSWISWPLGFYFQSDHDDNGLPKRFHENMKLPSEDDGLPQKPQ